MWRHKLALSRTPPLERDMLYGHPPISKRPHISGRISYSRVIQVGLKLKIQLEWDEDTITVWPMFFDLKYNPTYYPWAWASWICTRQSMKHAVKVRDPSVCIRDPSMYIGPPRIAKFTHIIRFVVELIHAEARHQTSKAVCVVVRQTPPEYIPRHYYSKFNKIQLSFAWNSNLQLNERTAENTDCLRQYSRVFPNTCAPLSPRLFDRSALVSEWTG